MPVSIEHVYYDDDVTQRELTITTSEGSINAALAAATPSNNLEAEGFDVSNLAVADVNSASASPTASNDEEDKQLLQQQLQIGRAHV